MDSVIMDSNEKQKTNASVKTTEKSPRVFDYLDYREFLKDFYQHKKSLNPTFSLAVFSQKAGLVTRNYLKRVIDGERPLTSESIPKFCLGLGLGVKEKVYFEALVNFNQTKDNDSKKHYFSALTQATENVRGSAVEVVRDQFEVYKNWYILPVRELVLLKDFEEDPHYIVKKMKNKISKKEAVDAIDVLLRVGLLVRDPETKNLRQANPIIVYDKGVVDMTIRDFHMQTLDRTKEAIHQDEFQSWDLRSLSIAISGSELKDIHKAIKSFIHELNLKYSKPIDEVNKTADTVILLNSQVIQLTRA